MEAQKIRYDDVGIQEPTFMRTHEIQFITIDTGEEIAYRQAGSVGPVIILIHGNTSSSVFFTHMMNYFQHYARLYAIDMSGFGHSSYNRVHDTLKEHAIDVASFMDAMDIDEAYVIGWSAGGGVTMDLALLAPEKVKAIMLLASISVKGYDYYGITSKNLLTCPIPTRLYSRDEVEQDLLVSVPTKQWIEDKDWEMILLSAESFLFNVEKPPREELAVYIQSVFQQRNLIDTFMALINFNLSPNRNGKIKGKDLAKDIQCPIHLVHGTRDRIIPYYTAYESLSYLPDHAQFHTIHQAGHAVFLDRKMKVYELIDKMIKDSM